MADGRPPILHRSALERVLARAAELQAANADVPESLTEQQLEEVAAEVGISTLAVRQALAEERMRVVLPEERGMMAQLTGPALFAATRVVPGNAKDVLAAVDRAFQRDENLLEKRRFPDRIVWAPRRGLAGALRAVAKMDGRGFPLVKADEVSATVVPVEGGRVHVRVEASLLERRQGAANTAIGFTIFGVAVTGALMAMSVMLPFAVLAGGGIAFAGIVSPRNGYKRDATNTQLALEQTLDRLEFGEPKRKSLLDTLLVGP